MHFFQLNIGEQVLAVGLKSPLQRGIYSALQERYFLREGALPDDREKLQEWTNARTKVERRALDDVLFDLFDLRDDGWHRDEWDRQIAEFAAKSPAHAEAAKKTRENDLTRLQRFQATHKRMREELAAVGVKILAKASMGVVREAYAKAFGEAAAAAVVAGAEPAVETGAETHLETLVETVETPPSYLLPTTQSPEPTTTTADSSSAVVVVETETETASETPAETAVETLSVETPVETPPAPAAVEATPAQKICRALEAKGITGTDPEDEGLAELLKRGAKKDDFLLLADKAKRKASINPFGWLISTLLATFKPGGEKPAGPGKAAEPITVESKDAEQTQAYLRKQAEDLERNRDPVAAAAARAQLRAQREAFALKVATKGMAAA